MRKKGTSFVTLGGDGFSVTMECDSGHSQHDTEREDLSDMLRWAAEAISPHLVGGSILMLVDALYETIEGAEEVFAFDANLFAALKEYRVAHAAWIKGVKNEL